MSFLDTYRLNKALTVLQTSQDMSSAETMQAVTTLKRLGSAAIPKLMETLAKVQNAPSIVALLASFVDSTSLHLFGDGLASANPRVVAGVVDALLQANTYDPNQLLSFYTDPRIAKTTIGKLLAAHKTQLQPEPLLKCLDVVRAEDRPLLVALVRQVATADTVPSLIQRITSPDESVRLAMVRLLTHFRTVEVQEALLGLLDDPHSPIRESALEGLVRLPYPLDVAPICRLLRDPVSGVRRQAAILLTQRRDPEAVPYLFEVLQDPLPAVQQGAVDLLAVLGDAPSVKAAVAAHADPSAMHDILMRLLEAPQTRVRQLALEGLTQINEPLDVSVLCRLLWDPDRTVRQQVAALLTDLNTPQTLPVLLEALQDESADIRQGAVGILNTLGDVPILKALFQHLQGKEWWATMRVTDALGRYGGPKIIDAAMQLSFDTDATLRSSVAEILKLTQAPQVFDVLSEALEQDDLWRQTCAAEMAGAIGEKRLVPALLHLAEVGETALRLVALRTLTTLGDSRAIPISLTHLRQGERDLQHAALEGLTTLTDVEHAEEVLQTVMTVRSTSDADLKMVINGTASTLIRRFGARAVGRSTTSVEMHAPAVASRSLLREAGLESPTQAKMEQHMDTPIEEEDIEGILEAAPTAEPIVDAAALEPGALLASRYRVVRQIGQGGFGTVILVEDMIIREPLVLKFLHAQMAADKRMIARFIQELRYARRVTHENVIRIHDFLSIAQSYAISMEYFPSHSLSAEIPHKAPMNLQRALRIVWYICRGMQAAHQAKIVHRDLKPPNVLIGDEGAVKIVDFGLAAAASDTATRLTRTGALLGTPLYMAPEQVENRQIDGRTDIYSLGVMMYEMCTGRPPYLGMNPMAILYQHLEGKAEPPRAVNPEVSPELEAIIQQAMAVDPEQRFQSMEALGKSLVPLLRQTEQEVV
jgi:serine/threonine-protein kinase